MTGSNDEGIQSHQVLVTEMPPSLLFEGQFQIGAMRLLLWPGLQQVHRNSEDRNRGECSFLFIYKLAAPHHVKLTPLMGSCLSCLKEGLSPAKPTHQHTDSVAVCLPASWSLPAEVTLAISWSAKVCPIRENIQEVESLGVLRLKR